MTKKTKIIARFSGAICGVLLAIVVSLPCMYFYYLYNVMTVSPPQHTPIEITINPDIDEDTLNGYTNIAFFGLDSRDKNYSKGNRSDSIMIISINNDTKEIKMASVYRDTYLSIPNHGLDKINHAYAFGGAELAVNTLNQNLDLNIKNYVSVNWFAAAKAVEALGGIELDVASNEVKELNRIIIDTNQHFTKKASTISSSGKQTLNGIQAVAYARIRKGTSGGDYKRAERQRLVLEAVFQKAKSANLNTVINVINSITSEISTNLSVRDMIDLAKPVLKYSVAATISFPIHNKPITINSISYGMAQNLVTDVLELHSFLFGSSTTYQPSASISQIQSSISNKIAASPSTVASKQNTTNQEPIQQTPTKPTTTTSASTSNSSKNEDKKKPEGEKPIEEDPIEEEPIEEEPSPIEPETPEETIPPASGASVTSQ